ncbi:MAG: zinc-ribbon domain-containing protein [Euryarchaeota archaeon]|nr:zinc-ribbon domain-containing protein [Euryarchaeota archaeon]
MYCVKCGAVNEDDANFCYKCGKDLSKYRTVSEKPIEDLKASDDSLIIKEDYKSSEKIEEDLKEKEDPINTEYNELISENEFLERKVAILEDQISKLQDENNRLKRKIGKRRKPKRSRGDEEIKIERKKPGGAWEKFKKWYNE